MMLYKKPLAHMFCTPTFSKKNIMKTNRYDGIIFVSSNIWYPKDIWDANQVRAIFLHNDKGETSKGIWHPRYMTLSQGMFISWECKKSHSWTRNIPTDRILNHRGPCFIIMDWGRTHGTEGMHHLAPDLVSCITKCFRNKR